MSERHLLLKELNVLMTHCRNVLAKFTSLTASRSAYFQDLQDYIELAADSEFKEYAANLKSNIEGVLNSPLPKALHVYREVQSIANVLKNAHNLSILQLRLLKRKVGTLIDFLSESLEITT